MKERDNVHLLEGGEHVGIAELLKEVANRLDAEVVLAGVDALARDRHRRLVLGLEHNVDDLGEGQDFR
jgi:hypothetical protein